MSLRQKCLIFSWLFFSLSIGLSQNGELVDLKVEEKEGEVWLKIIANQPISKYNSFQLQYPFRLVIDIYGVSTPPKLAQVEINTGDILMFYSSCYQQEPEKITRVVVKLKKLLSVQLEKKKNQLVVKFKSPSPEKKEKKFEPTIKIESVVLPKRERARKEEKIDVSEAREKPAEKEVASRKPASQPAEKKVELPQLPGISPPPSTPSSPTMVKEEKKTERKKPAKPTRKVEPKPKPAQPSAKEKVKEVAKVEKPVQPAVSPLKPKKPKRVKEKVVEEKKEVKPILEEKPTIKLPPYEEKEEVKKTPPPPVKKEKEVRKTVTRKPVKKPAISPKRPKRKLKKSQRTKKGRISFEFVDAELKNVLKSIILQGGAYPYIDEEVRGKISIKMENVRWLDALKYIVKVKGLSYRYDRHVNILRVGTGKTFVGGIDLPAHREWVEKEKEKRKILEEAKKLREATPPPTEKVFVLNYARAQEAAEILKNKISEIGEIEIIEKTNSLVITDTPIKLKEIEKMIVKIDVKKPQVMIEAKVVEVQTREADGLGIDWSTTLKEEDRTIEVSNLPGATGNTTLRIGTIMDKITFNATLKYMEDRDKLKVLSSPRISTMDGVTASMMVGSMIPYSRLDRAGNTVTEFINVGISLSVTPTITPNGYIIMNITPNISSAQGNTILTTNATTTVRVKDGETAVIGGLSRSSNFVKEDRVSFLEKFPLIGFLFRSKEESESQREILIFVTPHIIKD
jgi:hypothetical protein